MTFDEKLKNIRIKNKLTMDELAQKLNDKYDLNINKSTISRWEKGAEPSGKTLYYLADFFKTTPAFLLDLPEDDFIVQTTVNLPIVNEVFCGSGVVTFPNVLGYEPTPKEWLNGAEYFYLKATGDSMTGARIYDGDLVLIRQQQDFENGEICAVDVNGETLLKRVYKQGNQIILQSENANYPPRIIGENDEFRVIGKLKRTVIKY